MANLTASQEQKLRAAFDQYDTDHSGKISKNELKKVLQAMNINASDNEVQHLLTQLDRDNSGEIDYNEFKKLVGASFYKKHSRPELEAAFKKFDANGDGFITKNELREVISGMGRHLSDQEVEGMINSVDSSGDGRISVNEFYKLYD